MVEGVDFCLAGKRPVRDSRAVFDAMHLEYNILACVEARSR